MATPSSRTTTHASLRPASRTGSAEHWATRPMRPRGEGGPERTVHRRAPIQHTEEEEEMSTTVSATTITDHERDQIARANATKTTPVVFIHGLWLLPSSWD